MLTMFRLTFEGWQYRKSLTVLIVITGFMLGDIVLNFVRSTEYRIMTMQETSMAYLEFYFWLDVLNTLNLDQFISIYFVVLKMSNIKKVFRGSHTIKKVVTLVSLKSKKLFMFQ